jgi:hypothetical protein
MHYGGENRHFTVSVPLSPSLLLILNDCVPL